MIVQATSALAATWRRAASGSAAALVLAFALGACTSTRDIKGISAGPVPPKGSAILMMPLDIEVGSLQASGIVEPNAEWTQSAKTHVHASMAGLFRKKGMTVIDEGLDRPDLTPSSQELLRLHEVVGSAVALHKFVPNADLPTKKNLFDWSLGPAARELRDKFNADHALFVFVRDSYTSAGRAAVQVLAAILGVGVQGGTTAAYASLVDLRNGNIAWYNLLTSSGADLRDRSGAESFVNRLLERAPL